MHMTAENLVYDEQLDNELGTIGNGHEGEGAPIVHEPTERRENDLETL